jgi:DNA recombination protein RmuC
MDIVLIITLIVLVSLSLVTNVIFLIVLLKGKKSTSSDPKVLDDIARIDSSLQLNNSSLHSLENSFPLMIRSEINSSRVDLQKAMQEQSDTLNKKLNEFQNLSSGVTRDSLKGMNDSLNTRVDALSESLNKSLNALNEKVDKNLDDLNKRVSDTLVTGFKGNSDTMGELKEKLGKIDEAQKHLEGLQNQVITLNNVLSNNQARGQYGELQLEMLLEATFPNGKGKFYNIQDDLGLDKDGSHVRPDADIIFSGLDNVTKLCIDSKFPFASYSRLYGGESLSEEEKNSLRTSFRTSVKEKIKDIADKYIIMGKTMKYAIMFVPSDGVFAYIENEFPDLVNLARDQGVIISAPSTLQAIIVVFHGAALDKERTKNLALIDESIKALGDEFGRFAKRWSELEGSISTVNKKTALFSTTVNKIGNKFGQIAQNQIVDNDSDNLELSNETSKIDVDD